MSFSAPLPYFSGRTPRKAGKQESPKNDKIAAQIPEIPSGIIKGLSKNSTFFNSPKVQPNPAIRFAYYAFFFFLDTTITMTTTTATTTTAAAMMIISVRFIEPPATVKVSLSVLAVEAIVTVCSPFASVLR